MEVLDSQNWTRRQVRPSASFGARGLFRDGPKHAFICNGVSGDGMKLTFSLTSSLSAGAGTGTEVWGGGGEEVSEKRSGEPPSVASCLLQRAANSAPSGLA